MNRQLRSGRRTSLACVGPRRACRTRYGPDAVIKMRGARNVWLDLTADGDVFVPDRRFGRSRRLIDGSLLLSHTLLPIRLAPSFARLSSPAVSSHLVSSRLPPLVSSRFALLASSCYQHLVLLCPVLRPFFRSSFFLLFHRLRFSSHSVVWFGEGTSRPAVIVRVFAGPPINRLAARSRVEVPNRTRFLASRARHRVQGRHADETKFVLCPLLLLFSSANRWIAAQARDRSRDDRAKPTTEQRNSDPGTTRIERFRGEKSKNRAYGGRVLR